MALAEDSRFGPRVPDHPATPPSYNVRLSGRHVNVIPVSPEHASNLYPHVSGPENAPLFDYLFEVPPTSLASFQDTLASKAQQENPWTYAILKADTRPDEDPKVIGMVSLMRMDLPNRVIEAGSILYTPALQRTPAATEAMYLLARYVFETLGFRRYEWKCNALNGPSKRAALRLGFSYEGLFRQHMIAKGRNRDTAWFAMLDLDWPVVKEALEAWLEESNFDGQGGQRRKLEQVRESLMGATKH